jgi:O-antigen ligase
MSKKKEVKKVISPLLWIIYLGSAAALTVPLIISPIPALPVTYVQTILFQGIVELVFFAWLALALVDKRYRPGRNVVLIALSALVSVALIALFFVPDPSMSFWSRIWRMSGVWWLLHMFAWFLVLHSTIKTREGWHNLLGYSCVIAGIAFTIAALRWLRLPDTTIMGGTLGNPSHMSAYLLPHIFLSIYFAIAKKGFFRAMLITEAALLSCGIFMTGSRGGVVALVFGLVMLLPILAVTSKMSHAKKTLAVAVVCLVVVGSIMGALTLRAPSNREWGQENLPTFVQRLVFRDFGGDRWFLWKYALMGAKERPIFGWGNEGFVYLYDHYYDHESNAKEVFYERWQDRAHNRYLDILVAYGVVGLLAYLSVWLMVLLSVLRGAVMKAGGADRKKGMIFLVLLLTIAVYDLFMLETMAQASVVFLLFGLAAFFTGKKKDGEEDPEPAGALAKAGSGLLLFAGVVVVVLFAILPYIRMVQYDEAGRELARDPAKATELFDIALSWPNYYSAELTYGAAFATLRIEKDLPSELMEPLIRYLADRSVVHAAGAPISTRETLMASQTQRMLSYFEPDALSEAKLYANNLIELAPNKFDGYYELAKAQLLEGDLEGAEHNLSLAEERVYTMRTEFSNLVKVHQSAVAAAKGDYQKMYQILSALSESGYKLGDYPIPVIMMAKSLEPGMEVPDALIKYSIDLAGVNSTSVRTGLASAKIAAYAGEFDSAEKILKDLKKLRPDKEDEINAALEEINKVISDYDEEASE